MKKLRYVFLAALCLLFVRLPVSAVPTDADIPIDITVNGQRICSDAAAYLSGGTTYAPIRMLSDAFGADEISWNETTKTVSVVHTDTTLLLTVDSRFALRNGIAVDIGATVRQIGGRTFAPVRFLCTAFGADVAWDQTYYTVQITKAGCTVPSYLHCRDYSEDEIFWLARIIEAESSGEPLHGKIAVGNVVLNRVASPSFPDTIYGVIFDRTHGVQFQPVLNGTIYNTPSADSIIAAKRALNGTDIVGNALYFLNPRTASNFWIIDNRTFHSTIANHDFYL